METLMQKVQVGFRVSAKRQRVSSLLVWLPQWARELQRTMRLSADGVLSLEV